MDARLREAVPPNPKADFTRLLPLILAAQPLILSFSQWEKGPLRQHMQSGGQASETYLVPPQPRHWATAREERKYQPD
jgi:hypothetical protein